MPAPTRTESGRAPKLETPGQQAGSPGLFPVYSLAVDTTTAHIVYAGTNGGGVWTSADGGASWKSTRLANGMVLSLAADSSGALYAGTNSAGRPAKTWRSAPQGTTPVRV